jgi:hypothetical protein
MRNRKRVVGAAMVIVVVLVPGTVRSSNNGAHDFAAGGFLRGNGFHTGFSAHSGPQGENPIGHVSATNPGVGQQRYDVTCFAAAGDHAALGLVPSDAASNDATDETVLVVVDSGLPGGTGDLYGFVIGGAAEDCALYVFATPPFTPVSGNIVVNDAP